MIEELRNGILFFYTISPLLGMLMVLALILLFLEILALFFYLIRGIFKH
jgi:hypothetical protein